MATKETEKPTTISRADLLAAIGSLSPADKRALLGNQPVAVAPDAKLSDTLKKLSTQERANLAKVLAVAVKQNSEADTVAHLAANAPEILAACMHNSARRNKSTSHSILQCVTWIGLNPTA